MYRYRFDRTRRDFHGGPWAERGVVRVALLDGSVWKLKGCPADRAQEMARKVRKAKAIRTEFWECVVGPVQGGVPDWAIAGPEEGF